MNALLTSLAVLAVVVAGAFAGSRFGRHLPAHHLTEETKQVVKFGAGSIATLAALVLGLLVASAKSSYDAKAVEMEQTAAKIIVLDQLLRQYGPDAKPARAMLRAALVARYSMTWASTATPPAAQAEKAGAAPDAVEIRESIASLVPATDRHRSLQTRALQLLDDFAQVRWLFIAQATENISVPLLAVLVIWLATIAFCTGLYAPRNGTVGAVTLLCGVSVGAAVFLIVEMYSPFDGLLRISDAPLRTALVYLDR